MVDYEQVSVKPEPFGEVPNQICQHIYSMRSMGIWGRVNHIMQDVPPHEEQEIPFVQVTCMATAGKVVLATAVNVPMPLQNYLRKKFRLPEGLSHEDMILTPPARVYFKECIQSELKRLVMEGKLIKNDEGWTFKW